MAQTSSSSQLVLGVLKKATAPFFHYEGQYNTSHFALRTSPYADGDYSSGYLTGPTSLHCTYFSDELTLVSISNTLRPSFGPSQAVPALITCARAHNFLFSGLRKAGLSWKFLTLHHKANRRTAPTNHLATNQSQLLRAGYM